MPNHRSHRAPLVVAPLGAVAAALSRFWTRNLGLAFIVVLFAFAITFIPWGVIFFEAWITKSLYYSFVASIEEVYFGLIAITVTAILNYLEGADDRSFGRICAALTVICLFCLLVSVVGYFFAHFRGSIIFDPRTDGGTFVIFTLGFALICVLFSMMSILESRRMKDKLADYEGKAAALKITKGKAK